MKVTKNDLSSNLPIQFYSLNIYKPTLQEIYEMGVEKFQELTGLLLLSKDDIKSVDAPADIFNFLLTSSLLNHDFLLKIQAAFFTYLKKEIVVFPNKIVVLLDKKQVFEITEPVFFEFQNIIHYINYSNCDEISEEYELNTDDLEAKRRFEEMRQKRLEAKRRTKRKEAGNNSSNITISDIKTAVIVYGIGYTELNIYQLTLYQLYDTFYKCRAKEMFDKDHAAICAGAGKKIKLTDWVFNKD